MAAEPTPPTGSTTGRAERPAVIDRLALALDVDDLVAAERLARKLTDSFGVAKVGLELYTAAGPDVIEVMRRLGYEVFLDLKLHDIPTTVAKAAKVAGGLGVRYLTMHTSGGVAMLRAGAEGLRAGAAEAGLAPPIALGVTVLTSDPTADEALLTQRVEVAVEAGCEGIVCAAADLPTVRRSGPDLLTVVPGIRPAGAEAHDQARPATPASALAAGADLLVIGRAVTQAAEPAQAARSIVSELLAAGG